MSFPVRLFSLTMALAPSLALAGQLVVSPTSGIVLDEGAPRFGVGVRLSQAPIQGDTVHVGFRFADYVDANCYSDPNPEVAVECSSLEFTAANWDQPQSLWLYPNRDSGTFGPGTPVVDGDQAWSFYVEIRGDYVGFEGAPPVRISGITRDMDERGIFVYDLPPWLNEADGYTHSGQWVPKPFILTGAPTADVQVEVTSSDPTEGGVNPGYNVYTFPLGTWSSTQTLSLVTIDDPVFDGDRPWNLVATFSSADPDWDGVVYEIPMVTRDDESGGFFATPWDGLVTTEDGSVTASYDVYVTEPPWRPIVLGSAPDDAEGVCDPETLDFDADNWGTPQTVTVTGVQDFVVDGDVTYDILVEDWTPGFPLGPELFANFDFQDGVDGWTGSIGYGEDAFPDDLLTDAVGSYTLRQTVTDLEPGCEYQLVVDTLQLPMDPDFLRAALPNLLRVRHRAAGDVSGPYIWAIFWHEGEQMIPYVAQWADTEFEVGINARLVSSRVREHLVDSVSLRKWRCPTGYELLPPARVEVTNLDLDVAGFALTVVGDGVVSEGGATGAVALTFDTRPRSPVLVTLFVSDVTEGALGTTTVVVDGSNWNQLTEIPVFGVDDAIVDGDVAFTVTAVTSSSDADYDGRVAHVGFLNADDDVVGVVYPDVSGGGTSLVVSEDGGFDRFMVQLGARPGAAVTLDVSVDDASEGVVAPAQVTILPADWASPVTLTLTGVDDDVVDGDIAFTVSVVATSTDPAWDGISVATRQAVNRDDDVAGMTLGAASGASLLQTSQSGGTDTLVVVLDKAPLSDVTVQIAASDAAAIDVSSSSLVFTPANYATAQEVTLTGRDNAQDGDVVFVVTATTSSDHAAYDGLSATMTGTHRDDTVDPVDTGDTDDTDDTGDDDAGSCGCDAGAGPSQGFALLLAVPLLALRRRR